MGQEKECGAAKCALASGPAQPQRAGSRKYQKSESQVATALALLPRPSCPTDRTGSRRRPVATV
eukprot:3314055-Rhodomonas_salina.4